jgi:hypothetical protein
MLYTTKPFSSAELAYRQEKIRASFAQADSRRRYREQRRRARSTRLALRHRAHQQPAVSR